MAAYHSATKRERMSPDALAVLAFRNLLFDICNQNGGGHGGSAIGMAAIGVALFKYVMRYNPSNPDWFDRDRFVLSNGHASMFLYALNYLVGYDDWTLDELKGYGNAKFGDYKTMCHAHPEIQDPGIEVTTGPLGQGIANAVGLAIAAKNLAACYNKKDFDIIKSRIYCITGDGCLMEGVALESISLAGNLQLDNLVLIYDDNQVTCDGPLHWINSEDINFKMRASGWFVLDVFDGSHDVDAVVSALDHARHLKGKPVMVHVHTVIGVGTGVQGTFRAHHGAFDNESIAASKMLAGQDPMTMYEVPGESLEYFRACKKKGELLEQAWVERIEEYKKAFPTLGHEFDLRMKSESGTVAMEFIERMDATSLSALATREVSGNVIRDLWHLHPRLFAGGADLVNSCKMFYEPSDIFHPSVGFSGRFLRYGVREHAMAGISNGIAAFGPGTFLPVNSTFFMFYIYAAPSVRMGALSNLPVIHIATHDSIAEGMNGPTHQPVELDSLYRAMPNLLYIRPCDAEETIGAWLVALSNQTGPTFLSLGRDPTGVVPSTSRMSVCKGAYVVHDPPDAKLTLVSCGTNLHHVFSAALQLAAFGWPARVVSAPCLDLFDQQETAYRNSVFPLDGNPIISVEEYVATTWARYATASIGMKGYGYSASGPSNYDRFGLNAEGIVKRTVAYLESIEGRNARMMSWQAI